MGLSKISSISRIGLDAKVKSSVNPNSEHWLLSFATAGGELPWTVTTDSSNNIYVGGNSESNILTARFDKFGELAWQRAMNVDSGSRANSIAVSPFNGDIYVAGYDGSDPTDSDLIFMKYTSSGVLQWQRSLQNIGFLYDDNAAGIVADNLGGVYIAGQIWNSGLGNRNSLLAKFDENTGLISWQQNLVGTSNAAAAGVALDSQGFIYITGYSQVGGSERYILAKYDSSGVLQWQRRIGDAGSDYFAQAIAIDASDNIYITGAEDLSGFHMLTAKYNSSGTLQWQRRLTSGTSTSSYGQSISTDSTGNVYITGPTQSSLLMVKYDSAGTLLWQRSWTAPGSFFGYGIKIDSTDRIILVGRVGDSPNFPVNYDYFIARLPNDGSLTGTYTLNGLNLVYAASSLTASTSAFLEQAGSATVGSSSLPMINTTNTDNAGTLTVTKLNI